MAAFDKNMKKSLARMAVLPPNTTTVAGRQNLRAIQKLYKENQRLEQEIFELRKITYELKKDLNWMASEIDYYKSLANNPQLKRASNSTKHRRFVYRKNGKIIKYDKFEI